MKLNTVKRSGKQSLYSTFLALTLVPLLIFGLIITGYSSITLRSTMEEQVSTKLKSVAESLLISFDTMYPGDYNVSASDGEPTLLYKGGHLLSGDYDLIDKVKSSSGTEVSLFFYDNRLMTTIADSEGERYIDTGASETIMNEVYKAQQPKFFRNMSIGGLRYYAYYMPIMSSDGTVCLGMIGVATEAGSTNTLINKSIYKYIAIVVLALLITAVFVTNFTNKLVFVIKKIMEFMHELADGYFYKSLDPVVTKRTDELSELGRAMVKVQTALRRQIERDPLTGLFNRRSGEKRLDELQKSGKSFALAIGDIDFFKKFNDNYGHECGDEVLKAVARVLSDSMSRQGFVIRWGGEEFLIAFENHTALTAGVKAGEILQAVRDNKVEYNGIQHSVTMTFGVAEGYADRPMSEQINAADAKLYQGKEGGRNRVEM